MELRESGIDVVGKVGWGAHFCQFYRTADDLLDVLLPYFQAGLDGGEACVWITSDPLDANRAADALRGVLPDFDQRQADGQVSILPYSEWYLRSGVFDMDRVLDGWSELYDRCRSKGFQGLRVTGNTAWVERKDWSAFEQYEAAIDGAIQDKNLLVLCTYSLDRCSAADIADVVRNHQFTLLVDGGRREMIESTELKRARAALREALERTNADLERLVAQRTAELAAAHHRLATASERQRRAFARELHDSVGQGIVGLKMMLDSLERNLGQASVDATRQAARNAAAMCHTVLEEVRAVSRGMYPPYLEQFGLAPALTHLVEAQSCVCRLSFRSPEAIAALRFPPDVEVALFRIAQEAVSNALKHARASAIRITLDGRDGALVLAVVDDGVGFDPDAPGGGLGLVSMRERAAMAGGRLAIHSGPGGTRIEVVVSLAEAGPLPS